MEVYWWRDRSVVNLRCSVARSQRWRDRSVDVPIYAGNVDTSFRTVVVEPNECLAEMAWRNVFWRGSRGSVIRDILAKTPNITPGT